jgi:hypothetical protein
MEALILFIVLLAIAWIVVELVSRANRLVSRLSSALLWLILFGCIAVVIYYWAR